MRQSVPTESTKQRRGFVIRRSAPASLFSTDGDHGVASGEPKQSHNACLDKFASCFEFQALNAFAGKHDLVQIAIGMAEVRTRST